MEHLETEMPLKQHPPESAHYIVPESMVKMLSSINLDDKNNESMNSEERDRKIKVDMLKKGGGSFHINFEVNASPQQVDTPLKYKQEEENVHLEPKKIVVTDDKLEFGLGKKPWHLYTNKQVVEELQTTLDGLTLQEHERRLQEYGPNRITPVKQKHWIIKLFLNMIGGFQLFLWAGFILCLIVFFITNNTDFQTLALGLLCMVVVVLTACFQSYQEGKSDKVMAALKALTPQKVFVLRDKQLLEVEVEGLVPGDIVSVKGGEKVPADLRVLTAVDLKVNNASLTGENVDIRLGTEPQSDTLYEAKNIARSGCNFTNGTGICVVFSTGDNTFFGSIARSTTTIKRPPSCLVREIKRLIHIMASVAIVIGITFLILALAKGYATIDAIVFMIGIIVANVPEGLLPQLTVALTLTAQRMLKKGVVVSNLDIIETLGATTVICSDKTGTLTCNRMTVSHVVYDRKIFITPISPTMQGDTFEVFDKTNPHFLALQRIGTLNCDAEFLTDHQDVLKRECKGDASESSLIKFFHPLRDINEYRKTCGRVFGIPFNSSNKWMASIHVQEDKNEKKLLLMVKGAPERVLNMCSSYYSGGIVHQMTEESKAEFEVTNATLAKRGERVLAFAHYELEEKYNKDFPFESDPINFPMNNLVLVGYMSLIDPPRMSVKPAIHDCNTAGVKVFMVTGDHPITAHAIAKSLNLITCPTKNELLDQGLPMPPEGVQSIVVTGADLLKYTQEDWDFTLGHREIVFARTMPQQKQDIVRELTKKGHVVAMTGDGVNDAPALKAAHVGIAMGSGSAVAKEAGQIILLEDDFGSIVEGIREGRLIFDNLKKTICYVLSSNIPELIPFLLFIAMKIPLSIETIMIILIDVGTDLAPAVSLAYEEPEDLIMNIPPRSKDNHLVGLKLMVMAYCTIGFLETFGAYWGWAYVFYDYGFTIEQLMGAGIGIRKSWNEIEDQQYFYDLCMNNDYYTTNLKLAEGKNCEQDFMDWLVGVLAVAQSAFLMGVVWTQLGNLFIRKTQMATIFTKYRLFCNRALYYSIFIELVILVMVIYIPGLNSAFLLAAVPPKWASTSLWMMAFIVIFDETRKYFCRRNPKGWFARWTTL